MWSRLILNNEYTEPQTRWSSVAGTLISVSDGTPGSFPGWQQVCCLHCFHLFGSSCRISEDFVPSHSHLVSSWSTGGYKWPAIILASRLFLCGKVPDIVIWEDWRIKKSKKPSCLLAVGVLMTPFQVSTNVFLIWSVQQACWEGISNSGTFSCFQVFLHW